MQPLAENASNIPAFLGKLWKMVNDPNTDHLICWSPAGNSFVIQNQAQFWYELLPLYYKHNNMSSFVRQLNMYGFHKLSTVENGTMDTEKDEIQFFHRYFQKDQPDLLQNIKRKVTTSKTENGVQNIAKNDDISKVLTDVKNLHGRQSSVDAQLSAMKQENAVLWREMAKLRKSHIKQQQIVNKLIQFLVTLVQPQATTRIGVKRRMPLMLNESPNRKKSKNSDKSDNENIDQNDSGPTIHELDSEIEICPEELFEEDLEETGLVSSPNASVTSPNCEVNQPNSVSSYDENADGAALTDNFWDKPEFVEISQLDSQNLDPDDLIVCDTDVVEESINNFQSSTNRNEEVFLNPTTQDTLLSNLVNGSYNSNALKGKRGKKASKGVPESPTRFLNTDNLDGSQDTTVATRDVRINNGEDLDSHVVSTQSEIDQLKDILHGCHGLDANSLLRLFSEDAPSFGISYPKNIASDPIAGDPMVSGTESTVCDNNLIDFGELLDDSLNEQDAIAEDDDSDLSSTVNTPLIIKSEPMFPSLEKDL
nr:heat shock factor protein-like isoform X2 [Leptinotarsa decemlineata]